MPYTVSTDPARAAKFEGGAALAAQLYPEVRPFDVTLCGVVLALDLPPTVESVLAVAGRWHWPLASCDRETFAGVVGQMDGWTLASLVRHPPTPTELDAIRARHPFGYHATNLESWAHLESLDSWVTRELRAAHPGIRKGTKRWEELWARGYAQAEKIRAGELAKAREQLRAALVARQAETEANAAKADASAARLRAMADDVEALAGAPTDQTLRAREYAQTWERAAADARQTAASWLADLDEAP